MDFINIGFQFGLGFSCALVIVLCCGLVVVCFLSTPMANYIRRKEKQKNEE